MKMVAAFAQEPASRGAAHAQPGGQLMHVSIDHPSAFRIALENVRHSSRDVVTARRPERVSL